MTILKNVWIKKRLFPKVAKKYSSNRFSLYNRELDEIGADYLKIFKN